MSIVLIFSGCTNSPTNDEALGVQFSEHEIEINQKIEDIRQIINSGNFRMADSLLVSNLKEYDAINSDYGVLETVIEHGYLMAVTGRIPQAIELLEGRRTLLETFGSDNQKFKYFLRLASLYNAQRDSNIALEMIDFAIELGSDKIDIEQYIGALSTKASILSNLNRVVESIDLYQQAIALTIEHSTSITNLAIIYNNLGLQLHRLNRYDQALEEYSKSYEINIDINNVVGLGLNLNNIANTYQALGRTDAAIDTLKSAIALNTRNNNSNSLIRNYYNLGDVYYKTGDLEEAEYYFLKSYDLSVTNGIKQGLMFNTNGLARIRRDKDDFRGAIELGQEALALSRELRELEVELTSSEIIMTSMEAIGNYRGALEMRKIHASINDSLWTINSGKEIEEVRSSFAFSLLENEKELLEKNLVLAEVQNKRQLLYLILLVVIIIAISSFYFMLRRKNSQIADKNKKLEQLNEEKDILTKVVVHDMRNPLTALLGSIELLATDPILDTEQNEYIKIATKAGTKLKYMINGFLSAVQIQQETVAFKMIRTSIDELTSQLIESMESSASLKGIKIHSNLHQVNRKIYPEFYLHIVENLLSNSIKFSPIDSIISVTLENIDEHRWKLEVTDEGPGFSDEDLENVFKMFQKLSAKPTNGEESTGLGLFLVQLITSKLNGKIDILSEKGKGATIVCTFVEKD